jgi:hypothetical protein
MNSNNEDPIKGILSGLFGVSDQSKEPAKAPTKKAEPPIQEEPKGDFGLPEFLQKKLSHVKMLSVEEAKAGNQKLHEEWNRLNALINEFSCGNNSTKAQLFHVVFGNLKGISEVLQDGCDELGFPGPICDVLDLAVVDMLRNQLVSQVNKHTQKDLNEAVARISEMIKPSK